MAVLEAILPAVARNSGMSLQLYRVAALSHNEAARDLIKAASTINNFASTLKQIGTIIKEDDRLPSSEVRRLFGFFHCTAALSPCPLDLYCYPIPNLHFYWMLFGRLYIFHDDSLVVLIDNICRLSKPSKISLISPKPYRPRSNHSLPF